MQAEPYILCATYKQNTASRPCAYYLLAQIRVRLGFKKKAKLADPE